MKRSRATRGRLAPTIALLLATLCGTTAHAQAEASGWQWLRSKNRRVEKGNERMAAGDAKGALEHYASAARELPAEGGVHLNRGLALLATGDLPGAREALRLALEPPAPTGVRADAHYDLGVAFYGEADALAGEERHDEAQKLFREAIDAFRQALRLRPRDRSAAWNLELAARRLQEQREKQEKKEQEQEQQEKDQQKQEDAQDPGEQKKDDEAQQEPGEQGEPSSKTGDDEQQAKQDEPSGGEKPNEEKAQSGADDRKPAGAPPDARKPDAAKDRAEAAEGQPALPSDVAHALDALQDSEQNLERVKAQLRARREQRRPEKDW